ncbi:MAG: transglycosylase domain-containing protein [Oligoflexales bacterium]
MKLTKKKKVAIGAVLAFVLFCAWFVPPVWQLRNGYIDVERWPKSGRIVVRVGPGRPGWIKHGTVSLHVLHAIVAAEDSRFYQHNGLDFIEIVNSIEINWKKGKYVRGGSTITQQVVKMSFLSMEKSMIRKIREAVGALLLETILPKEKILEWYINLAEFGDGVYGIKAAARHYFQLEPELLTIQHGANLALVLPSPRGWSKGLRQRRLTTFGHNRYKKIIDAMRQNGFITQSLWEQALATGDFGRPINSYYASKTPVDQDPTMSDEELSKELRSQRELGLNPEGPSAESSDVPQEEPGSEEVEVGTVESGLNAEEGPAPDEEVGESADETSSPDPESEISNEEKPQAAPDPEDQSEPKIDEVGGETVPEATPPAASEPMP